MASDDIVEQAALRRNARRPRATDKSASPFMEDSQDLASPRGTSQATSPRRSEAAWDTTDDVMGSLTRDKRCHLPFLSCKVCGKEVKALVSTVSPTSCINKEILNSRNSFQNVDSRVQKLQASIDMEGKTFQLSLDVQEDVPDVVLGLDFLTSHQCSLNLGRWMLTVGLPSPHHLKLLPEAEVPLKFRNMRQLASSF